MARKLAFILNPRSGKQSLRRSKSEILKHLLSGYRGVFRIFETQFAGHGSDLAARAAAEGFDVVVAYGGDGTINEVATGLVGTRSALGIIPAGSGNGMAGGLGIPKRPQLAVEIITDAPFRAIDVGRVDGQCFFNVFGLGFDAFLADRFHREAGSVRGKLPYFTLGARSYASYLPPRLKITTQGERWEAEPLTLAIANGPEYGSGARIAPHADFGDGWLDLVTIDPMPTRRALLALPRLFTGGIGRIPEYHCRRIREVTVQVDEIVPVHFDGEPKPGRKSLHVWVEPGALKVVAP